MAYPGRLNLVAARESLVGLTEVALESGELDFTGKSPAEIEEEVFTMIIGACRRHGYDGKDSEMVFVRASLLNKIGPIWRLLETVKEEDEAKDVQAEKGLFTRLLS
jgi:hypothetical protein